MLDDYLNKTVDSLTNFKEEYKNKDEDGFKKAKNYFEWIKLKTDIIINEDNFSIPKDKEHYIRRQYVPWIHFGFNVGREFGGKHPAIILKITGDSMYVLPLSSGRAPEEKRNKPYIVEIPYIQNLKEMPRWCNVYRIVNVSMRRIDFDSPIGRVQGKYLDKINEAIDFASIKGKINE